MRRRKTLAVKVWEMNLSIKENHIREVELSERNHPTSESYRLLI